MAVASDPISLDKFDAVLFDLDGVLTATAKLHAAAWKQMFDEFLKQRAAARNEPFTPFEIATDYKLYVDGKPRYEGVRSFLESRDIQLPYGDPNSPPNQETICGLGNRKNDMINDVLNAQGVEAYEGSVTLVRQLRSRGVKTAVVSSSANCEAGAPGSEYCRPVRCAGRRWSCRAVEASRQASSRHLPGSREAARCRSERAVVVEDAISGVQAGRAGEFGLVVGVDRKGDAEALSQNGADLVVKDLGELVR